MEKNITIVKCNKYDFIGVLKLLKQLWPKRIFITKDIRNTFCNAIKSSNQHYFCAKYSAQIVGFGSFNIKQGLYAMGKIAILDELIVDDKYREMGIAKQLLDFMFKFAKKSHCLCIELECGSHRKPAQKFYEKYGFDKGIGCIFSMDVV